MGKVIIMSGVSGSGKSTLALSMHEEFLSTANPSACSMIVSADRYFVRDGLYCFNPAELSKAHAECFRSFINCLGIGMDLVIVDNTNTTSEEIAPYVLGAQAFGYDVEILTVDIGMNPESIDRCAARNAHSVPVQTIVSQARRIRDRRLPPWWNARTVPASF